MILTKYEIDKIDSLVEFEDRIHAAALLYADMGMYVIPVLPNDKAIPPKRSGINYSHASKTRSVIDKWFGEGGRFRGHNLGIACGRRGGAFVVDVDKEDRHGNNGYNSLDLLEGEHGKIVTPTAVTPSGGKHFLFQWDDYASTSSGRLAPAVDTRGGDAEQCRSHIVAYPSTRDNKEYRWTVFGEAPVVPNWIVVGLNRFKGKSDSSTNRGNEEIDCEDIESKYTPRQIWKMLEHIDPDELDYEEWVNAIQAVHSQHPDEVGLEMADEWSKRGERYELGEVHRRWSTFDEDGEIRIGTLIYMAQQGGFNPRTEPKGAEGPSPEVDDVVGEYNEKYGVVMVGSKLRVLMEQFNPDPFQDNFKLLSVQDFKSFTANDTITVADRKGNPKPISKGEIWFADEERRQFVNGLRFEPDGPREIDGCFNIWEGWRYQEEEGDWSLFKAHVRNMVGTDEEYEWLMDWMADALQDPTNPKGCAVVMKGIEGTGKGTIANIFGELFGRHFKHVIQEEQLVGRFNGHFEEALVVFADEVTYGGNKKVAGTLKGMVTERKLMVERKGLDAVPYRNCMRLVVASNEDWFIPAGPHSRRWYVIDIPPTHANNESYFDAIYEQMEDGGYEAMMYELRRREIKSNLKKAPETELLMEQRARYTATNSVVEWWADRIDGGVLGVVGYEEIGEESDWPELAERAEFYTEYQEWCKENGTRREPKPAFYSKLEREFGLVRCRPANPNGGTRKHMYKVPTHEKCCFLLEKATGIKISQED